MTESQKNPAGAADSPEKPALLWGVRQLGQLDRVDRLLTSLETRASIIQPPAPEDCEEENEGPLKTVPRVKDCDWEHFVNRFDPAEPMCSIDVLVAGTKLNNEITAEVGRRMPKLMRRLKRQRPVYRVHRVENNSKWIQRVRIQSPALLAVFSLVTGYDWGTQPHTFMRPFPDLIHYYPKLKDELQQMESIGSPTREQLVALGDLRCYIDFFEQRILPDFTRIRDAPESSRPRILFSDLWYLFKPGDLIYVPPKTLLKSAREMTRERGVNSSDLRESPWHQSMWRLLVAEIPEPEPKGHQGPEDSSDGETSDDDDDDHGTNGLCFRATCYYLDFNGKTYGALERSFRIDWYAGEKDVRELDVYPLRFAHEHQALLKAAKEAGELFTGAIAQKHMICNSWTCGTDPMGIPTRLRPQDEYAPRARVLAPEYVEGEVIVDLQETFNTDPRYQQAMVNYELDEDIRPSSTLNSWHKIIIWNDLQRSKRLKVLPDNIRTSDEVEEYDLAIELRRIPYLRASTRPSTPPTGDDLALLPLCIFVYALRLRRFLPVDVRNLQPVAVGRGDPLQDLQLPDSHKTIIRAAVETHLRRQTIQRRIQAATMAQDILTQDIIAGKGRGLLIMLHGEPGVGKTATAEAIARSNKRPLFSISCNELISPVLHNVELALDDVFRLAHLWDCVLLMDEADVFLAARNSSILQQDSLVSMFLRKLEYYNGILFLTTNRIGKVDQAISSRIHLILHYKRLGLSAIEKIFAINIRNLEDIERQHHEACGQPPLYIVKPEIMQFAVDHYNRYPNGKGVWNGRQIRNAFLVASSLARHEADQPEMEGRQPQLRYEHFREVEKLTREYNQFRARVLGGDDSRKARLLEERDDDYEGDGEEAGSTRPGASASPTPSASQLSSHRRTPSQMSHASPGSSQVGRPVQWSPTPTVPRIQVEVHPDYTGGRTHLGYPGGPVMAPTAHQQPHGQHWQSVGTMHPGLVAAQQGYSNHFANGSGHASFHAVPTMPLSGQDAQNTSMSGPSTPEPQVGRQQEERDPFRAGAQEGLRGETRR